MATADPIDLEGIIKKWAEMMFNFSKSKEQSRIPKDALEYTINWKRVHFVHDDPEYLDREKPPKPTTKVLFRTFFTNQTTEDQEYSFRTSRATSSTCDVIMEQCYTVGYEMNLSLKTPGEVFEANAGFRRELSLTNASTQSIQKSLTWEVDSQIKVPSGIRTTAELVVSEDQFSGGFKMTSKISGKVLVTVTNRNDNNSLVKILEGNIVEIIRGMKDSEKGLKLFKLADNVATFVSRGRCTFRYAIEQHIKLHQHDANDEEQ
ncbi:hypothetical protein LSH36_1001g00011 [Paralvinella palmiformis]|uniref:Uncharacterized protein n=1 Tax=Paralvinella palmiformis TaxID=53620 RepID=A0AAD9MSC7_9ANNE|nr:hypothetical protein LSH36_1001g00011 [Paralvinella palmiformis]